MNRRVFVDTNVWVYAVDDAEPVRQARARQVLEPTATRDLVVSAQVLGEFFAVVTRKLQRPAPAIEARQMVAHMSRLPVVPVDVQLVDAAMAGTDAWQASFWDALIIAAAHTSGCDLVLSEDLGHGRRYGSVVVEDPFRDQGA